MQALCLAKLLLTAGERLIVGSAVSSQGFVCPLTPGMYVMTREGRAIHIQHNMRTQTHTHGTHTVACKATGMYRRTISHVFFSPSGFTAMLYGNRAAAYMKRKWYVSLHHCREMIHHLLLKAVQANVYICDSQGWRPL